MFLSLASFSHLALFSGLRHFFFSDSGSRAKVCFSCFSIRVCFLGSGFMGKVVLLLALSPIDQSLFLSLALVSGSGY